MSAVAAQCAAASAQPAESGSAEQGMATLEAFLDGVQSLTADFKQELWTADQKLLQTETGSLSLKRPNRFRWTYVDPTELVVVADGTRLWIYDIELAQVTVAPFDDTIGASPAMLLSGDRNVREEFEVVDTYPADGLDWVKLAPLAGGSDFGSVLDRFQRHRAAAARARRRLGPGHAHRARQSRRQSRARRRHCSSSTSRPAST